VVVEDTVQLSGEVRVRLDVIEHSEEVRERDLFNQDMKVRTEDANKPVGEEPLRGLPTFEVRVGKHGRAYAVEPGVTFDPPAEVAAERHARWEQEAPQPREPVEVGPDPPVPISVDKEEEPPPEARGTAAEAYKAAAQQRTAPGGFADTV
jgi:hypothetical protein